MNFSNEAMTTTNGDDLRKEYRGFVMERDREFLLWRITGQPAARCPNVLQGCWTNIELLMQAIDNYLLGKEEEKDAKKNNSKA
jgi:hypothetical protein